MGACPRFGARLAIPGVRGSASNVARLSCGTFGLLRRRGPLWFGARRTIEARAGQRATGGPAGLPAGAVVAPVRLLALVMSVLPASGSLLMALGRQVVRVQSFAAAGAAVRRLPATTDAAMTAAPMAVPVGAAAMSSARVGRRGTVRVGRRRAAAHRIAFAATQLAEGATPAGRGSEPAVAFLLRRIARGQRVAGRAGVTMVVAHGPSGGRLRPATA